MKTRKVVVSTVLVLIGIVLMIANGTIPILGLLSYDSNYLIVTADDYWKNVELNNLVSSKRTEGYNVDFVNITTILSTYPEDNVNNLDLLKTKVIENIYTDSSEAIIYTMMLGSDGKFVVTSFSDSNFRSILNSTIEYIVYFCIFGYAFESVNVQFNMIITYDVGQTISVVVVPGYKAYGLCSVKKKGYGLGDLYYVRTKAESIREYIFSHNSVEYVTLVGDITKIDSVYMIYLESTIPLSLLTHKSDHFYSIRYLLNNRYMLSDIVISRLPASNSAELNLMLSKLKSFKSYMSEKALMIKGPETGSEERFNSLVTEINQTLNRLYGKVQMTKLVNNTLVKVTNAINSENDNVIFFCHGATTALWTSIDGAMYETTPLTFVNCTVMIALACYSADFSRINNPTRCIGESMMIDFDSKTIAYMGAVTPSFGSFDLCCRFYKNLESTKTIGKAFTDAKAGNLIDITDRLCWNLFGEPTAILYTSLPVPSVKYGWLDLSFTINGSSTTKIAAYSVTFPNGTVKSYTFSRSTINYCPIGGYTIDCTYNNKKQTQSVGVSEDQGTSVNFNFFEGSSVPKEFGNMHITSNVVCEVQISCTENNVFITRVTPIDLVNYTEGTYHLKASYGLINHIQNKTQTVYLTTGDSYVHFQFDIPYEPQINITIKDVTNVLSMLMFLAAAVVFIKK